MDKRLGNELELKPISEEALEQERLQLLDRLKEIEHILEGMRAERKSPVRQNAEIPELKGVNKYSPVEEKLKLFKNLFLSQGGSKVQKPGNRAISPFAKTNGRLVSAKSRR